MQVLRQLIAKALNQSVDKITDNSSMENTEAWDSLAHMDVILSIEQHYGINLEGDEIADMLSVRSIADALAKKGVSVQ